MFFVIFKSRILAVYIKKEATKSKQYFTLIAKNAVCHRAGKVLRQQITGAGDIVQS